MFRRVITIASALMLNSPNNSIFVPVTEHGEFIAAGSPLRLWLIGGLFTVAAVAVIARLAWVQTQLPADYLTSLTATTVEEELIPARDGRILAGSTVLAANREQSVVQLHYRWLQKNADPGWMKLQIRQRLSREERRDTALLGKTGQQIRAERDAMLQAVGDATKTSITEMTGRCERIEQRIQRISDSVNRRLQGSDPSMAEEEEETPGFLLRWASSIREKLTTPPQREDSTRIPVKEQESWHTVLDEVSDDAAAQIREHPEMFPGVRIVAEMRRTYPAHDLAAHLVGARTKPTDADRFGQEGVAISKDAVRIGRFGVEKSYSHRLSGVPGVQQTVRDRRQRVVSSEVTRKPVSGRDVVLTIDVELQTLAEQLLAESLGDAERTLLVPTVTEESIQPVESELLSPPEPAHIPVGGSVVIMEADSGRIAVAASAPDFDLSMFTDGSESQWKAVNGDTRQPFVSRCTSMALPPGSTFKIVTAIAGLQTGALTPEMPFECRGYLSNPDEHRCLIYRLYGRGHDTVNLRSAMAQSCNVYFFDAARRIGIGPLVQWTDRLGFGQETGIDLPFEKPGTVPSAGSASAGTSSDAVRRRFEREALGLAIGQSRLTVTPVQMARLLAFVSNGGWLVTPHVVSDEGTARQASDVDDSPFRTGRHRIPGVTEETLAAVRGGLLAAVEEPTGTGFKTVRVPGVTIAGKTGTAETSPGKPDHAWFVGYVPADKPRYVVVVVLEHGGSGGKVAGPVARELVKSMLQRGLIFAH